MTNAAVNSAGNDLEQRFADDVAAIAKIAVVSKILELTCRITGMGFSAVARVTDTRWIACAVRDEIDFGLEPGGELAVKTTLCDEVRESGRLVVIDHVAKDESYCGHPTPQIYGFQSYISVPIRRPDGEFFGTLCAIDPRPARVNTEAIIGTFTLFADLLGFHLDAQDRLAAAERALSDEKHAAELREQFVAVLGHDLRNPLSAIQTGAAILGGMALPEQAARIVSVTRTSADRMAGLVSNLLDFARARLGQGLPLETSSVDDIGRTVEQVISELRIAWPDRAIDVDIDVWRPVTCDRARVSQLLSNLVANALTHGDRAAPVSVVARTLGSSFELSVANAGEPIAPERLAGLFAPFSRAAEAPAQQGLGLGLYIASQIARAHGGRLTVSSTRHETRFTFLMPLGEAR
jgi:signal transduction histidine kinase